jgi:hypothetical protein
MLGAGLAGQKKYAEAEALLLSAYGGLQEREATIPAARRAKLKQAERWIVELYEGWGRMEMAAKAAVNKTPWRMRRHADIRRACLASMEDLLEVGRAGETCYAGDRTLM